MGLTYEEWVEDEEFWYHEYNEVCKVRREEMERDLREGEARCVECNEIIRAKAPCMCDKCKIGWM
jgi:hypothetical protein